MVKHSQKKAQQMLRFFLRFYPKLLDLGLFEPNMSMCFGIIFLHTKFIGSTFTIFGGGIKITRTGFGNETNFLTDSCHFRTSFELFKTTKLRLRNKEYAQQDSNLRPTA